MRSQLISITTDGSTSWSAPEVPCYCATTRAAAFLRHSPHPCLQAIIAAGDWDQDGLMDVVGTNGLLNLALVGWNHGGGNFTYVSTLQSGFETGRVGAADLNGDGLPEIVTANLRARSLSVFENRTLSAPTGAVSRKTHGSAGRSTSTCRSRHCRNRVPEWWSE